MTYEEYMNLAKWHAAAEQSGVMQTDKAKSERLTFTCRERQTPRTSADYFRLAANADDQRTDADVQPG